MKKRGKELSLNLSNDYNVICGTVDNKNTKTVYLNISAWGEPLDNDMGIDYSKIVNKLSKSIRRSTYNHLRENYNNRFYPKRSIVDLDMRDSGIKYGKRSFMCCDITIFQKDIGSVFSEGLPSEQLKDIASSTIKTLEDFDHFKFHMKKS